MLMSVPLLDARGDGLDMMRYALFVVSLVSSVIYLGRTGGAWYPLMPWLKALPVGALALLTAVSLPGGSLIGLLLVAALAFSTLGDIFLALRDEKKWFVFGLGAFLIAHLAYIAIFAYVLSHFGLRLDMARLIGVAVVIGAAGMLHGQLKGGFGEMAGPVALYMTVIVVMVVGALLLPPPSMLVVIGALLFMGSDAMIAVAKFGKPFGGVHHLIWGTYYAAQYLLMAGILQG
ncbi:lysoplasmalogenase [Zavarzinia compransoris]|uniref:lysoplasmalogenase n=1 Tax=Zavarzinia marina TaxID=2911065 RepID=UPI001F35994B|nr:lysoplasmalogenase [Zavarzinia marina]MCF4166499.1 lysoplasmalogenase [Zavarzinia marina]